MRFLIRILLLFFVISAVLSIIRGALAPSQSPRPQSNTVPPKEPTPNRLAKDPVCGTYVAEQTAIRAGEYFFCSNECRSKYLNI